MFHFQRFHVEVARFHDILSRDLHDFMSPASPSFQSSSPAISITPHRPYPSICKDKASGRSYLHQMTQHSGDRRLELCKDAHKLIPGVSTARLHSYCWMISQGFLSRLLREVFNTIESSRPRAPSSISRYDASSLLLEDRNPAHYMASIGASRSC